MKSEPRGTSPGPNVESLVFTPWKYAICPDRDLNPEPSDWCICVLTMRPPWLSVVRLCIVESWALSTFMTIPRRIVIKLRSSQWLLHTDSRHSSQWWLRNLRMILHRIVLNVSATAPWSWLVSVKHWPVAAYRKIEAGNIGFNNRCQLDSYLLRPSRKLVSITNYCSLKVKRGMCMCARC